MEPRTQSPNEVIPTHDQCSFEDILSSGEANFVTDPSFSKYESDNGTRTEVYHIHRRLNDTKMNSQSVGDIELCTERSTENIYIEIESPDGVEIPCAKIVTLDKLSYCNSWVSATSSSELYNYYNSANGKIEIEITNDPCDDFMSCPPQNEVDWEFYSISNSITPECSESQSTERLARQTDTHMASGHYVITSVSDTVLAGQCSDIMSEESPEDASSIDSFINHLMSSPSYEPVETLTREDEERLYDEPITQDFGFEDIVEKLNLEENIVHVKKPVLVENLDSDKNPLLAESEELEVHHSENINLRNEESGGEGLNCPMIKEQIFKENENFNEPANICKCDLNILPDKNISTDNEHVPVQTPDICFPNNNINDVISDDEILYRKQSAGIKLYETKRPIELKSTTDCTPTMEWKSLVPRNRKRSQTLQLGIDGDKGFASKRKKQMRPSKIPLPPRRKSDPQLNNNIPAESDTCSSEINQKIPNIETLLVNYNDEEDLSHNNLDCNSISEGSQVRSEQEIHAENGKSRQVTLNGKLIKEIESEFSHESQKKIPMLNIAEKASLSIQKMVEDNISEHKLNKQIIPPKPKVKPMTHPHGWNMQAHDKKLTKYENTKYLTGRGHPESVNSKEHNSPDKCVLKDKSSQKKIHGKGSVAPRTESDPSSHNMNIPVINPLYEHEHEQSILNNTIISKDNVNNHSSEKVLIVDESHKEIILPQSTNERTYSSKKQIGNLTQNPLLNNVCKGTSGIPRFCEHAPSNMEATHGHNKFQGGTKNTFIQAMLNSNSHKKARCEDFSDNKTIVSTDDRYEKTSSSSNIHKKRTKIPRKLNNHITHSAPFVQWNPCTQTDLKKVSLHTLSQPEIKDSRIHYNPNYNDLGKLNKKRKLLFSRIPVSKDVSQKDSLQSPKTEISDDEKDDENQDSENSNSDKSKILMKKKQMAFSKIPVTTKTKNPFDVEMVPKFMPGEFHTHMRDHLNELLARHNVNNACSANNNNSDEFDNEILSDQDVCTTHLENIIVESPTVAKATNLVTELHHNQYNETRIEKHFHPKTFFVAKSDSCFDHLNINNCGRLNQSISPICYDHEHFNLKMNKGSNNIVAVRNNSLSWRNLVQFIKRSLPTITLTTAGDHKLLRKIMLGTGISFTESAQPYSYNKELFRKMIYDSDSIQFQLKQESTKAIANTNAIVSWKIFSKSKGKPMNNGIFGNTLNHCLRPKLHEYISPNTTDVSNALLTRKQRQMFTYSIPLSPTLTFPSFTNLGSSRFLKSSYHGNNVLPFGNIWTMFLIDQACADIKSDTFKPLKVLMRPKYLLQVGSPDSLVDLCLQDKEKEVPVAKYAKITELDEDEEILSGGEDEEDSYSSITFSTSDSSENDMSDSDNESKKLAEPSSCDELWAPLLG